MDNHWELAQALVDAGKGQQVEKFKDTDQGTISKYKIKAEVYFNWYTPQSPAVMLKNAETLKADLPLYWLVGDKDRMQERGINYAYNKAPAHPMNEYVVVKGDHKSALKVGRNHIPAWLQSL